MTLSPANLARLRATPPASLSADEYAALLNVAERWTKAEPTLRALLDGALGSSRETWREALQTVLDGEAPAEPTPPAGTLLDPAAAAKARAAGVPLLPHYGAAAAKARGEPTAWRVVGPEDVGDAPVLRLSERGAAIFDAVVAAERPSEALLQALRRWKAVSDTIAMHKTLTETAAAVRSVLPAEGAPLTQAHLDAVERIAEDGFAKVRRIAQAPPDTTGEE